MKKYIKPAMEYVELRSEERFAGASACHKTGTCGYTDPSTGHWITFDEWVGSEG